MAEHIRICEVGTDQGVFLPLGGDSEQNWPRGLRIVLYFIGLFWCFMGVAIVADIFMSAIECITSKKTRKFDAKVGRWFTVEVWNPTVANLTLMALGSSAPEILLSVIELLSNSIYSGDLGPSTIVGSAAFNLLCIVAVCIAAIPDGEFRRIKEMPVYCVTASFSLWAYFWLLVILMGTSPNVVEPWEGLLTFLMFPGLVLIAFMADQGYFSKKKSPDMGSGIIVLSAEMSKEELAELDARIRKEYGKDLTAEQVSKIARIECGEHQSRAQYRVAATRAMIGGKRVKVKEACTEIARTVSGPLGIKLVQTAGRKVSVSNADPSQVLPFSDENVQRSGARRSSKDWLFKSPTIIGFQSRHYAVLENAGCVKTTVKRTGNEKVKCSVNYKTRDGSATAQSDYEPIEGTLVFEPGETEKNIVVKIIDDIAYEEDEEFFVDLFDPTIEGKYKAQLSDYESATIVIIDDDLPGILVFPEETLHVPEDVVDREMQITVHRQHGCTGKVTCKYKTENSAAIAGTDFDELDGTLEFDHGETEAIICVNIKARGRYERSEDFRIVLYSPTGGARFDGDTDGGVDSAILTLFIESEKAAKDRVDRLVSLLAVNWDKAKVGHSNWRDQFAGAIYVNGGSDEDEEEDATIKDWFLHIITVPWKLLFALVPPTDYCGGWVCFFCSLGMIAIVTAIIGDMANLLGCVLDIPTEVTAITFVALGTSLPDTFASKAAATQDVHADASIGNVTGSNSVNVFLGLGLPWMLGSIFWVVKGPDDEWNRRYLLDPDVASHHKVGGAFVVKAGSLAFSVIVFSCSAVACMILLYVRRIYCKGELGGPTVSKRCSAIALVGLWLTYVGLSSWKSVSDRD